MHETRGLPFFKALGPSSIQANPEPFHSVHAPPARVNPVLAPSRSCRLIATTLPQPTATGDATVLGEWPRCSGSVVRSQSCGPCLMPEAF